jgi:aryl-alcohol dehydrogenase-like predicted oxidoreductase
LFNLTQGNVYEMNYRCFGETGLRLSELGFGCGSVGGLFIRGNRHEMIEAVERALELGINYFDTASIYGDGLSESNLGTTLLSVGARVKGIIVGTKVRLTSLQMSRIHDAVIESVDQSLRRLKLDSIDLIQLHNPLTLHRNPERNSLGVADLVSVMDAFTLLRDQGKVKLFGINGLGETEALLQAVQATSAQSIQICYNLLNPSAGYHVHTTFPYQNFSKLLSQASKQGLGVIAIRVLAGGALSGHLDRHTNAAKTVSPIATGSNYALDVAHAQQFQFVVEQGYTDCLAEAAIRFVISNCLISTTLIGFSSVFQVEQAANYVQRGPLHPRVLRQIESLWSQRASYECV